jgi:hypothetical protein
MLSSRHMYGMKPPHGLTEEEFATAYNAALSKALSDGQPGTDLPSRAARHLADEIDAILFRKVYAEVFGPWHHGPV